jgi:O-antigen/teichoic acid export membrane protein
MCTALLLGGAASVVLGAVWFIGGSTTQDFGWVALWAPAIAVQDAARYAAFADRIPAIALESDALWAVGQGAALALFATSGHWTAGGILSAWGIGAAVGACYAAIRLRAVPAGGSAKAWLRQSLGYSSWLFGQSAIGQIGNQAATFALVGVLGTAGLAGYRAIDTLLRPVALLIPVFLVSLVPRMSRLAAIEGTRVLRQAVTRATLLYIIGAGALAALAALVAPHLIGLVVGGRYVAYRSLIPPMAGALAVQVAASPATAALRAVRDGRRILVVQLCSVVIGIPILLIAAANAGPAGAAWGTLGYYCVLAASTVVFYRSSMSQTQPRSVR